MEERKRLSILKKSPAPTITKSTRRISFSDTKCVKEFLTGEDKATIWGTSYEEEAHSLDSNKTSPENITIDTTLKPPNNTSIPLRNSIPSDSSVNGIANRDTSDSIEGSINNIAYSYDNRTFNATIDVPLNAFEEQNYKFARSSHETNSKEKRSVLQPITLHNNLPPLQDSPSINNSMIFHCSFIKDYERKFQRQVERSVQRNKLKVPMNQSFMAESMRMKFTNLDMALDQDTDETENALNTTTLCTERMSLNPRRELRERPKQSLASNVMDISLVSNGAPLNVPNVQPIDLSQIENIHPDDMTMTFKRPHQLLRGGAIRKTICFNNGVAIDMDSKAENFNPKPLKNAPKSFIQPASEMLIEDLTKHPKQETILEVPKSRKTIVYSTGEEIEGTSPQTLKTRKTLLYSEFDNTVGKEKLMRQVEPPVESNKLKVSMNQSFAAESVRMKFTNLDMALDQDTDETENALNTTTLCTERMSLNPGRELPKRPKQSPASNEMDISLVSNEVPLNVPDVQPIDLSQIENIDPDGMTSTLKGTHQLIRGGATRKTICFNNGEAIDMDSKAENFNSKPIKNAPKSFIRPASEMLIEDLTKHTKKETILEVPKSRKTIVYSTGEEIEGTSHQTLETRKTLLYSEFDDTVGREKLLRQVEPPVESNKLKVSMNQSFAAESMKMKFTNLDMALDQDTDETENALNTTSLCTERMSLNPRRELPKRPKQSVASNEMDIPLVSNETSLNVPNGQPIDLSQIENIDPDGMASTLKGPHQLIRGGATRKTICFNNEEAINTNSKTVNFKPKPLEAEKSFILPTSEMLIEDLTKHSKQEAILEAPKNRKTIVYSTGEGIECASPQTLVTRKTFLYSEFDDTVEKEKLLRQVEPPVESNKLKVSMNQSFAAESMKMKFTNLDMALNQDTDETESALNTTTLCTERVNLHPRRELRERPKQSLASNEMDIPLATKEAQLNVPNVQPIDLSQIENIHPDDMTLTLKRPHQIIRGGAIRKTICFNNGEAIDTDSKTENFKLKPLTNAPKSFILPASEMLIEDLTKRPKQETIPEVPKNRKTIVYSTGEEIEDTSSQPLKIRKTLYSEIDDTVGKERKNLMKSTQMEIENLERKETTGKRKRQSVLVASDMEVIVYADTKKQSMNDIPMAVTTGNKSRRQTITTSSNMEETILSNFEELPTIPRTEHDSDFELDLSQYNDLQKSKVKNEIRNNTGLNSINQTGGAIDIFRSEENDLQQMDVKIEKTFFIKESIGNESTTAINCNDRSILMQKTIAETDAREESSVQVVHDHAGLEKQFEENSETTETESRLFRKNVRDSICFSRTAKSPIVVCSLPTTPSSNFSPNTTAALCNIDPNKITEAGYRNRRDGSKSSNDNTLYREFKRDYVNLTVDNTLKDCLEHSDDIHQTQIDLVESTQESLNETVEEDICETSVRLLNRIEMNRRNEAAGSNVLRTFTVEEQQALCKKCRNCQKAVFTMDETTLTGFELEPDNPDDLGLDFSGLHSLRGLPRMADVVSAFTERLARIDLDLDSSIGSLSVDESTLLPDAPSAEFLLDNYAIEYSKKLKEERENRGNVYAIYPLIPTFEILWRNYLDTEINNWNFCYFNLPFGTLECRHKKVRGLRLLVIFDSKDLYSSKSSTLKFTEVKLTECPLYNRMVHFIFDDILYNEVFLRVSRNHAGVCRTSDDLCKTLEEIHNAFEIAIKLRGELIKVACLNGGHLEYDERGHCIVKKTVPLETDKLNEFRIRIRNIEKMCFDDVTFPASLCFDEDLVNRLPTGLDFLQTFLADPVGYLK